jgi:hypothetical protein
VLVFMPAIGQAATPVRSAKQVRTPGAARTPPILVIIEHGRIAIEADAASLDSVLQEIGWPQAYLRTGSSLRFVFSSSAAKVALQRRLKDANYVVVESKAGRGHIRLYPDERGNRVTAGVPAGPWDQPRLITTAVRLPRRNDPALVASLRQQFYTASTPAERARALDELALYAEEDIVRETALDVLGREQNAELLESVLEALDNLKTMPVRPLLDFIARERRPELRVQAIELVARHGGNDPAARDLLGKISAGREDEAVRRAARSALEDLTPGR